MLTLESKADYLDLFKEINTPLRQHYVGRSRIFFGATGVGYGDKAAGMEGFARMMWGAGPAYTQLSAAWQAEIRAGILAGTDPKAPDYWGDLHDRDQRMVEMPAIALALLHCDAALWHQYSAAEQTQISTWLQQIFAHQCADGNWQFFKVLVYSVLRRLGLTVDDHDAKQALAKIERCYRQDGWYQDSSRGREDYYTPFAFEYYGILYSVLNPQEPRSEVFRQRARAFAKQFIHFFATDGANVPFGRSLTYRYAAVAFWVACVYGDILPEKTAELKGLINRNLRWWFNKPIRDHGLLTLGYGYPQLLMTEPYNSPTSPYWANKVFLLLALPADHAFFHTKAAPLPQVRPTALLASPHLLAQHDNGHTVLLNAGQPGPNYHALTNQKYFKFAYSSAFGFSVPRENELKEEAVMDSMLGLTPITTTMTASRGGKQIVEPGNFMARNNVFDVAQDDTFVASSWQPTGQATVRTWLVPIAGWQVRIHHLQLDAEFAAYETGFAVADDPDAPGRYEKGEPGSTFVGAAGFTGIVDLTPGVHARPDATITGFPNTNLMTPQVVALPGRQAALAAGSHWLVTGVYAHPDADYGVSRWANQPVVTLAGGVATISCGEQTVTVPLT
ncbi:DUF2264 domain-containing protein [Lacticaseibacillus sp. GG6-2]